MNSRANLIFLLLVVFVGCDRRPAGRTTASGATDEESRSTSQNEVGFRGQTAANVPAESEPNQRFTTFRPGLKLRPLAAAKPSESLRFHQLEPADSGVDFENRIDPRIWLGDYETLLNGSLGGAVCVGDVDGDRLPDLFFTSREGPDRLYRNLGGMRFLDVTESSGIQDLAGIDLGAAMADVDDDGDLDLYVCRHDAPNLLYLNHGGGVFSEHGRDAGLDFRGASVTGAFADYDRDGDLDVYLVTNRLAPDPSQSREIRRRMRMIDGRPWVPEELREVVYFLAQPSEQGAPTFVAVPAGQRDRLLENDGTGRFVDVSSEAGIEGYYRGHHALWWDYDGDGFPDLYVANDFFDPDRLYRNNGDGTFTDVAEEALPYTPWFSMGCDSADVDGDGRTDLLSSDMASRKRTDRQINTGMHAGTRWFRENSRPRQEMRNALFLNTGAGRFAEGACLAGIAATEWTWAVKFGDLDNDGRQDLFVTNGFVRNVMDADLKRQTQSVERDAAAFGRALRKRPPLETANLAFHNRGCLDFVEHGAEWGLDLRGISTGAALADLDRDGDLDVAVNNLNAPASIYRHDGPRRAGALVELRGTKSNHFGSGAMVQIEAGGATIAREFSISRGYASSEDPVHHFGLGDATRIDRLTVAWPSGCVQTFDDLPSDHWFLVTEPPTVEKSSLPNGDANVPVPLFTECATELGVDFVHADSVATSPRQPLLPYAVGALGAGLAWGDANGDEIDDLLIGGGAGQPGQLLIAKQQGGWKKHLGPWREDGACRDSVVMWLDADSDGQLDLLIGSDSPGAVSSDDAARDRLYMNRDDKFEPAADDKWPVRNVPTGAAAAADYDGDGDLDLFVGARHVAAAYPQPARSELLRNEGGAFVAAAAESAPELGDAGIVNDALWSDVDLDGDPDLLLAVEWGPLRFFRNREGRLHEETEAVGLAESLGRWNAVVGGDFDCDGDFDYVAANIGLNIEPTPSPNRPHVLLYGPFAVSGEPRLIEAVSEAGGVFPLRTLADLASAGADVAGKFANIREFAAADVSTIFGPDRVASAMQPQATTFATTLLINHGGQSFESRPMPWAAQLAPVFGMATADFDCDGHLDVCLGQNFAGYRSDHGPLDGGVGTLMLGDGQGNFQVADAAASGFIVPGDAKSVTVGDFNRDGRPDLGVTQNQGRLLLFRNQATTAAHAMAIGLRGPKNNPRGVGAIIQVEAGDAWTAVAEVRSGGGFRGQSSATQMFAPPAGAVQATVRVHWPDGLETTTTIPLTDQASHSITYPAVQ